MEIFKDHPQWRDVKEICSKLKAGGFTAWLAGGCVRDGILGILPHDFDIASNAKPTDVEKMFKKTIAVGKAFGMIRVVCDSGAIEVARFRRDGHYSDGRHPDQVQPGTPLEDAQRRDFTINALFYDPFENKIHDLVEGSKDIYAKRIRTVGDPELRFQEDHLRLLRAVRFVAQLDFEIESQTLVQVSKLASLVKTLSGERINDELGKLFRSPKIYKGTRLLKETGLLMALFPELETGSTFDLNSFKKIEGLENQSDLAWLLIFDLIPPDKRKKIFERLKFSNHQRESIKLCLKFSTDLEQFPKLPLSEKKLLASRPEAVVGFKFFNLKSKTINDELGLFLTENQNLPERLLVGEDIMELGIKSGKEVGSILQSAMNAQLEGIFNDRESGLRWLKKNFKKNV